MSAYQVLARTWRPQKFSEIIGQDHIAQTLTNIISSERIGHAYLFSGTRGVGKTSIARIFAKALNCDSKKSAVEPCNECPSCKEISTSISMDVMEIDGASNNGVDSIRDLREQVGYKPSSGNYRIYIVDEVHMLSGSAFNALLKTLEEPPSHVIFMFATTEIHKIPQTILSRCQRFNFRKVSRREISDHLKRVSEEEGIKISPSEMVPLGTKAPAFELPEPLTGKVRTLDDLKSDRATLVMFICNHCPFVKHLEKALVKFTDEYLEKGVSIVAINSNDVQNYPDDSPEKMVELVKELGYKFPYLFDESQKVAMDYSAACTPDFFLYDKDLNLVYRGQFDDSRPGNGTDIDGADLRDAIDKVLSGEKPSENQKPSIGCNIKWKN